MGFCQNKTAIYFPKTPFRSDKTPFYFCETAFYSVEIKYLIFSYLMLICCFGFLFDYLISLASCNKYSIW